MGDEVDAKPSGPYTGEFDFKKWQWMMMVDKLVKELNLTPEAVYSMNYIDCLNWLSMYNEKDKYIARLEKERMKYGSIN